MHGQASSLSKFHHILVVTFRLYQPWIAAMLIARLLQGSVHLVRNICKARLVRSHFLPAHSKNMKKIARPSQCNSSHNNLCWPNGRRENLCGVMSGHKNFNAKLEASQVRQLCHFACMLGAEHGVRVLRPASASQALRMRRTHARTVSHTSTKRSESFCGGSHCGMDVQTHDLRNLPNP